MRNKYSWLLLLLLMTQQLLFANKYRYATYTQVKNENKVWGSDRSHHQDIIDWEKLKEQRPHFIFLKVTEGATHNDRLYKDYYEKAKDLDIHVGSYHFFSYRSPGKLQAKHFLKLAKYRSGDLPLVLDAEYGKSMPHKSVVTRELISFLKTVKSHTGHKPIIYCDYDSYVEFLKGKLNSDYLLWICDYRSQPDCSWTFWQTTDKFKIAGIRGYVDLNFFNGTNSELKKMLK